MKKLLLLLAMMSSVFASCSKEEVDTPMEDNETYYTVQLGWGGELDITYEPLTKASSDDLYGIQVYSTPNKELEEGQTVTWTPYAYGLFDDASNITINLLKGYKYKFEATMVVDGKNLIGGTSAGYYAPFNVSGVTYGIRESAEFNYSGESHFYGLGVGKSFVSSIYDVPNTDRYYGELEDFIPGQNNDKAKIKMARVSFGAKFKVQGKLATSGKVEIKMSGAPELELALAEDDDQISDIYTFSDVYAAWKNSEGTYSETIETTINWIKSDGTTIPLGSHNIAFKRNTTTVVTIEIENEGITEGFGFEIAETGTMPDDEEVTIKDGEIVNAGITTTIPNTQIWYKATEKVEPAASADFGATIVSNEFENGEGIITFDGDVTSIGAYAFENNKSLTHITFPNSLTSVGKWAFYGCTALTGTITIPNNVVEIGEQVFYGAYNLTAFDGKFSSADKHCIVIDNTLIAFAAVSDFTSYTIPDNITSIGEYAFCENKALKEVVINDNIQVVGKGAFASCSNLENVSIGSGVTTIAGSAFFNCPKIVSVVIPASVQTIENCVFESCTSLVSVHCKPSGVIQTGGYGPTWMAFDKNATNRKIYVPADLVSAYKATAGWSSYADYIEADPS